MNSRIPLFIAGGTAILMVVVLAFAFVLTPENQNPAFNVAVRFINAAGTGDDATAYPLLSDEMQAYVDENCPEGSVSACVLAYTPDTWGQLLHDEAAVFRRSIPDGDAWDVQIVATYEEEQGFAGVCIYHRMEEVAEDDWRVAGWSGFVSCDDADSGIQGLRQPDAPNRVVPGAESATS